MSDDDRPTHDDDPADEPTAGAEDSGADEPDLLDGDQAEDADHGEDLEGGDEPPPLALPLWKLVAGGVAVVVVVLLAVGAAVVLLGGDDEDDGGGGGDGAAEEASIVDSFDRADAPNELGSTESGQPWTAESGVWGVQDERAVLVEPNPDGQRSIAVVDVGSANATITVTAGTMRPGWGIVFRYQGPFNYWFLTASPDFATYNLGRVVDGQVQPLGGVGLAEVADGSVLQVRLVGSTLEISVNGNTVKAVTDTTLMGATNAGLLAFGQGAADASWDSFEATPLPGGAGGVTSPQTVPPPGGSTTTVAGGAPQATVAPGATPTSAAPTTLAP
jgi:hypothetical protein